MIPRLPNSTVLSSTEILYKRVLPTILFDCHLRLRKVFDYLFRSPLSLLNVLLHILHTIHLEIKYAQISRFPSTIENKVSTSVLSINRNFLFVNNFHFKPLCCYYIIRIKTYYTNIKYRAKNSFQIYSSRIR